MTVYRADQRQASRAKYVNSIGQQHEYRLTERQVKQYNQILMDPDALRRYERLDTIKEAFLAYS